MQNLHSIYTIWIALVTVRQLGVCMYVLEKGAPSFYADKDTVLCVAFYITYSHMQNRVNV
jgi:hypothetical protein